MWRSDALAGVTSLLFLAVAEAISPAQSYFVLHSFSTNDGLRPVVSVVSGSSLYGCTSRGGAGQLGTLFRVNTDGTGFAVLKHFTGVDGGYPGANLVVSGPTLYGGTGAGGLSNNGVLFKINTDGSGYTVLKQFATSSDGASPGVSVLSGTTLYGTAAGGVSNAGILFKMNTDGSGYTVLKTFTGANDGSYPRRDLLLSGTTLFGAADGGGISNNGVLFRINSDGTGYTVLRAFAGGSDGAHPDISVLSGATLYGTTVGDFGLLFRINTDGNDYSIVKRFAGGSEGGYPSISALSGSTLFGATQSGGISNLGGLFKVDTDGSGYTVLKQFADLSEGVSTGYKLSLSGTILYGGTGPGGITDSGVVFGLALPTSMPNIFMPPENQTVALGSAASFGVGASGIQPLVYQWFHSGQPIGNPATSSDLVLPCVGISNDGIYVVVVTNLFGTVTSPPAMLNVIVPGDTTVRSPTEEALRLALAQGNSVRFECDGMITLSSMISVARSTVLDGNGHKITISGGNVVRVFGVAPSASLTLMGLSIENGFDLSSKGGGIFNAGTVNATNCVFRSNGAYGVGAPLMTCLSVPGGEAFGGAIYNIGTFNADQCSFLLNSAVGGGGSWIQCSTPQGGTPGGAGGGAFGGAICNLGELAVHRSLFASNAVCGGTGGYGQHGWGSGDEVGSGARGGAGGSAGGGAVFNSGAFSVVNCSFTRNLAAGGPGGPGGPGGTVWYDGVLIQGYGGAGGAGGDGLGAIYSTNGPLGFTNCTIANNSSSGGTGGLAGAGRDHSGPPGQSGTSNGALTTAGGALVNMILASNAPANCFGWTVDLGHNLSSDGSCAFAQEGSFNNVDPRLAPLADNGGPTLTLALLAGSPAIDAADAAAAPLTDQRGAPRIAGTAADIGAYEYGSLQLMRIAWAGTGMCNISLREVIAPSCRLLTTTDFVSWSSIATNQVGTDGTASFNVSVDPHETARFYRAALP